jgi:hypothetical protein
VKILQGQSQNISFPIIGKVSRSKFHFGSRKDTIFVCKEVGRDLWGYAGIVTGPYLQERRFSKRKPAVFGLSEVDISCLQEGDVIMLEPNGQVRVVWDDDSPHNSILATESCNCR